LVHKREDRSSRFLTQIPASCFIARNTPFVYNKPASGRSGSY
jgi:hypothetical protein